MTEAVNTAKKQCSRPRCLSEAALIRLPGYGFQSPPEDWLSTTILIEKCTQGKSSGAFLVFQGAFLKKRGAFFGESGAFLKAGCIFPRVGCISEKQGAFWESRCNGKIKLDTKGCIIGHCHV